MAAPALQRLHHAVHGILAGQPDAATGCLLALLARRHALLEGPPGCGKTALAEGLAQASGASFEVVAFHRETRAADLFGAPVLHRRAIAGGERLALARDPSSALGAEVLVLDDLPRAPGELLAPWLRRLPGGGDARLECAVATATPPQAGDASDPLEPAALDRFAVQVRLRGLLESGRLEAARHVLDGGPAAVADGALSRGERHALQAGAAALGVPAHVRAALLALAQRLATLRAAEGAVAFSDRSLVDAALPLLRAHALLRGAGRVGPEDLRAVRWMLGRRVPDPLRPLAEELVEEAARGAAEVHASVRGSASGAGRTAPPSAGAAHEEVSPTLSGAAGAPGRAAEAADVGPLLLALEGRLEPGRAFRRADPGGAPRRQARLARLDELEDADPAEALLFVDGVLPGAPTVLRREGRRASGALAVLRDVSASMEGALGQATSRVVTALVRLAARRRMRVGYLEFHHGAEAFEDGGAFFHRRYGKLLGLAARQRAEGRTSYEAALRTALAAFGPTPGSGRHAVLLTDGVPVLGDPQVLRERALARRLGVRVHTVYMGHDDAPAVLERLARETGGLSFVLETTAAGTLRVRPADAP